MKREEVDYSKVTPMMRQYLEIKNKNEDIVIFFRLGDFYEMFFEDAINVSRDLELTLTGKNAGLDSKIPMCGVPQHAASVYIDKLVELGYKVGICEQLEDAKNVKGIVKRDIVRIVSSGTVMDSSSLDDKTSNYIANIIDFSNCYIISYIDLSTGEVGVEIIEHNISKVVSCLVNLSVKEVITNSKLDEKIITILKKQFNINTTVSDEVIANSKYDYITADFNDIRINKTLEHIITYLLNTQKRDLLHLEKAYLKNERKTLRMDLHTKRNLELTSTLRLKQRENSLLDLLDYTKTAMGSRKLKYMIENPFCSIDEIYKRYDMVDKLMSEFILKEDLRILLDEVYDLERLSGRIAYGNANARDLIQLKNSIKVLPNISALLKEINFYLELSNVDELYNLLENSIYDNPPIGLKEGFLIKEGFNSDVDELKSLRKGGKDFVATFERTEREKTGIKTLKVGYNRVFGYYIEVSKGQTDLVKEEYGYERKQTLSNCERYISPILKEKESLILNAEEKLVDLEYDLFNQIKETVKSFIPTLQSIAKVISEIDVIVSFAVVSEKNNYTRPVITEKRIVDIKSSRHPVVEQVITGEFVDNDFNIDLDKNILLITGPNMAGKSTYMRQLAITVVMAQIGCFVPASSATIALFDAIFTRIGASDDLVSGESTFMVEMNEANFALSNATPNSLILFDELGRGTATFDGMALAQAIIEHIHDEVKAITLFSTHYHELTDLVNTMTKLKNVHVSAYERDGELIFLHKIKEGSVDKSYGIHVAKLANLPTSLITRANQILKVYENNEVKRDEVINIEKPIIVKKEKTKLDDLIDSINPLSTTPIEALNILFEIEKIKKEEK